MLIKIFSTDVAMRGSGDQLLMPGGAEHVFKRRTFDLRPGLRLLGLKIGPEPTNQSARHGSADQSELSKSMTESAIKSSTQGKADLYTFLH